MKPLGKKLIVLPDGEHEHTRSGLIIPKNSRDKVNSGTVIDVGEEVKSLKPKQRILFNKYNPYKYTIKGEEVWIVEEEDVQAIYS